MTQDANAPGQTASGSRAVRPRGGAGNLKEGESLCHYPHTSFATAFCKLLIWRINVTEKGTFYSVTPSRSYKKGDDQWKQTETLGSDDLLSMAKLFDNAHSWILHQMRADAKARKDAEKRKVEQDAGETAFA